MSAYAPVEFGSFYKPSSVIIEPTEGGSFLISNTASRQHDDAIRMNSTTYRSFIGIVRRDGAKAFSKTMTNRYKLQIGASVVYFEEYEIELFVNCVRAGECDPTVVRQRSKRLAMTS